MTYNMLKLLNLDINNSEAAIFDFEIPVNCNSSLTESGGIYSLEIRLNSGETDPSKDFEKQSVSAPAISSVVDFTFEQYESNTTVNRKPKVIIEF